MTDITMTLSNNLKKFREERELSKTELAKRAGISRGQLGLIEKGDKNNSRIQTLINLCQILDISLEDLFQGSESKTDKNVLRKFEKLRDEDKKTVNRIIDGFIEKDK